MITTIHANFAQMELDLEVDAARQQRQEWQRAIDNNLHAIADYVHAGSLIVWQPGEPGRNGARAFDVQVTSQSACTCQRHRLIGRCPHTAFAQRLVDSGHTLTTDTPIAAVDIEANEVTA